MKKIASRLAAFLRGETPGARAVSSPPSAPAAPRPAARLKRWEVALAAGLVVALLTGSLLSEKEALAGKFLRLHVLAASDDPADQALKLEVRDVVLAALEGPLFEAADARQAEEAARALLPELTGTVNAYLAGRGSPQRATVELGWSDFPTREYGAFALPAGRYRALRVILDEGKGQNWWCVVFPPLCSQAALSRPQAAARQGGLTPDETGLITRNGQNYVIRFKLLEWLGALLGW